MVNERGRDGSRGEKGPVTIFGPDFPFPFDDWIAHPAGLGSIPAERHGEEVAVVGAGISGLVAAYELMRLGVKPVVYEASRMGGRLRSQAFEGAEGVVAELGGMRFPVSSTAFYHYVDLLGLQTRRSRWAVFPWSCKRRCWAAKLRLTCARANCCRRPTSRRSAAPRKPK